MNTILQRIQQIAVNEGIKITAFEKSIGASKGVLSRAINNGTDIQAKWQLEEELPGVPLFGLDKDDGAAEVAVEDMLQRLGLAASGLV